MLETFQPTTEVAAPDFLAGGGEMGERTRAADWSRTPLGPAPQWPAPLQAAARMVLASAHPACIWWGAEQRVLYNDACRLLVGDSHPAALGLAAPVVWREIWPEIEARAVASPGGDGSFFLDRARFVVERHGSSVEAWYSACGVPVGERGGDGGVLCTFHEVTAAVVAERQLATLRDLVTLTAQAHGEDALCEAIAAGIARGAHDVPFAGVYLLDPQRGLARLAACHGIEPGHPAMPVEPALDAPAAYPLARAVAAPGVHTVELPDGRFGTLPRGVHERPPLEAAMVSLGPVPEGRTAVLVAALHPRRLFDEDYRCFLTLAAAQASAAIANALARDEERRRAEAETLQEIARDIASELDLKKLVQKVTDAATRLTGAAYGAFFHSTVAREGRAFELYTLSGAPREAVEGLGMPRATPVFKPTFLGQGPVRVDDVTRDPRYGQLPPHFGLPPGHFAVRSYLAVPVVSRTGDVLGGLLFGHPQPGVFDAHAERNAMGIAAQAAVAIDNARLYGQAREELERRGRMERDLRESERRYREVVQGLPAAIYTTDAEGAIEVYNEAAVALWGREPVAGRDRWCGAHRLATPGGEPVPLEECFMATVLRGVPCPSGAEIVVERPDGTSSHVLVHPRALRDERGRIVGAINMLVDITSRKAAEAELAATKDELGQQVESLTALHELSMRLGGVTELRPAMQAILDTAVESRDGDFGLVWLQDGETGELVVEARRGFDGAKAALFGRIPAGPEGGAAGDAFARRCRWVVEDTETDALFAPYREAARAAGFRAVHSTPIVTRSGAQLGVLCVHFASPRRPSQRDLQVADVCARHAADAIEAMRTQEALRESERIYRAIGESIDYGVWITDAEGRITYTSESFLRLVGMPHERWCRDGWKEVVHPEDVRTLLERWKGCLADGRQLDQAYRVRCRDGHFRTVLCRGVPVRNERGTIVAWAGINLDIERLKQVENELRELDQRKNEFLATLAHELRNPLAPLRNGLEVMRLAKGDAQAVEKARGMMERQLAQMVRLVDDLLDVSRVSRGKIVLRKEDVEIAAVLRNAVETSQPLMSQRGHVLTVRIPDERIVVHADMTRLSQVFWNLLNNAAKYTEPGGRVELAVSAADGEVRVGIRDDGIGIPPEMQARVFDIFTQVDRSLEKSQGGLGIGLSIAKRLVEMHGGSIEVRSGGHRQGTEFTVRLPARLEPRPSTVGNVTGPHVSAGGPRHRILVADDNADSATTLSLMLEVMGNEVRVAHDGHEAVRVAEEFRPDTILLDIGMPRMNGYDACQHIRARAWGGAPYIIALTGWGQDGDKSRSKAAGFDRHLVKPVEPHMLEGLIRSLPSGASAPEG